MSEPFPSICVNWSVYDVPAIWAMVGPEREWVSREQTSAWLRTSEMLDAHQSNLQLLRDRVTQRWSPESSAASRALIKQLDSLIHSVTTAAEAARTNATAVSLLTDALMEARARVEPLHGAWLQATTEADQARLNRQAWTVMSKADSRVIEHASLLTVPPDYVPPSVEVGTQPPSQGGPRQAAPVTGPAAIPPLKEAPGSVPRQPNSSGLDPAPSQVGPDSPSRRSASPILAGGGTTPAGQGTGAGNGIADTWTPPRFLPPSTERALPIGGVLAAPRAGLPGAPAMRSGVSGLGAEPEWIAPSPVNGVIGGKPNVAGRAGRAAPAETTEPMMGGLLGSGLGSGGFRSAATDRRQYPADEEWEMPTGVEPVIRPGPEPDPRTAFDPGPNVIGLRR